MGFDLGSLNPFDKSGEDAQRTQQVLTQMAEKKLFERFEELRKLNQEDFEASLGRVEALRNPALAQISGLQREFEAVPQQAAARSLSSASATARLGGGSRSGQTFGLARSDIARRGTSEAGLEAAILRMQGLQGRTSLTQLGAQLEEGAIGRQANLFGQDRTIQGTLATAILGGQTSISGAGLQSQGQILSAGVQPTFGQNISRGVGDLIGNIKSKGG